MYSRRRRSILFLKFSRSNSELLPPGLYNETYVRVNSSREHPTPSKSPGIAWAFEEKIFKCPALRAIFVGKCPTPRSYCGGQMPGPPVHPINIYLLLASFARSVRQVMDRVFSFARPWKQGRKKRGSITCCTDRANEANKMFIIWLCWLFRFWKGDRELAVRTATYGPRIDQSQHAKSVSHIINKIISCHIFINRARDRANGSMAFIGLLSSINALHLLQNYSVCKCPGALDIINCQMPGPRYSS